MIEVRLSHDETVKIIDLEAEIAKLKSEHEAEIERLVKEGKVRVIEKPYSVMEMLMTHSKPKKEYKGFDDVKAEVEEHFKQGLFNEALEKYKQEQLADKETAIDDLKAEVERLKNRSLWERIRNK